MVSLVHWYHYIGGKTKKKRRRNIINKANYGIYEGIYVRTIRSLYTYYLRCSIIQPLEKVFYVLSAISHKMIIPTCMSWCVCVLYSRLSRNIGITQDPSTVTDFDLYSPKQSYVICYVLWDSMHKIVSVLLCTIKYNHNTFHHLLPIYFNVNFNLIVSFLWLI